MTQSDDSTADEQDVLTDGGGAQAVHENTDYLEHEVNIFRPSTAFMRDKLKMIVVLFAAWMVFIFGPVTASLFAEEFMTETTVLGGFPLNFFLTAIVSPLAALVLAATYALYRDRLDVKYGISHETPEEAEATVAADGSGDSTSDDAGDEAGGSSPDPSSDEDGDST